MEDLNELANKINQLDDAQLADAIKRAGDALGLDSRLTDKLVRDRKTVRRKLGNANARDLNRVASLLKPEQIETIKRCVEGEKRQ